jgi:membrane-associated phospholipid phosphatase
MDPILYWNNVALTANRKSHTNGAKEQTGPALSSRALAIVHLAMYEGLAGALGFPQGLHSYLELPAPSGAPLPANGPAAAVAAAAHTSLCHLFPSQREFFDQKLAGAGLGDAPLNLNGSDFGRSVANKIIADRKNDPDASAAGYQPPTARGAHRPDPDNAAQPFDAPFYGAKSRCFAVTRRHSLDQPPQPGDREYADALRRVRAKGIAPELASSVPGGSRRTADETLIGLYWAYDGAVKLGTPPRLYNQIIRKIAIARHNTAAQNARLFALVNVAMADAGILAWDDKYRWNMWRPVLGVREHDTSMGPTGVASHDIDNDCDPLWLPLGAPNTNTIGKNSTPPFPAYPSGHATFGAAAFHVTRLFYGVPIGHRKPDKVFEGLSFVSDELNGESTDNKGTVRPRHVRDFPQGLWQMIIENGLSRVFLGVHWLFDAFAVDEQGKPKLDENIGGVRLGLDIAEDIFKNGLKKSRAAGPRL